MVASEVGRIPCAGISPPPCIIQTFNCRDRVENNHRLDIFYVHHHPDAKTSTGCPLLCWHTPGYPVDTRTLCVLCKHFTIGRQHLIYLTICWVWQITWAAFLTSKTLKKELPCTNARLTARFLSEAPEPDIWRETLGIPISSRDGLGFRTQKGGCLRPLPTSPLWSSFQILWQLQQLQLSCLSSDLTNRESVSPQMWTALRESRLGFSEWDHDPLRRGFSIKSPIENETRTSEGWEGLCRSGHFCKAPYMKSTCKTRENKREYIQLWHTNNKNIYNVCSKHIYYI